MATISQQPGKTAADTLEQAGTIGAVVVGGDHPGLAIARSLGRRGIPVYVIDDQYCISSFSRYATKVIRVESILDERKTVEAVLEVGRRYGLSNWVLFPTRDENVAAFSRYRSELAQMYRVTTGDWESIEWAWDKKKTYELAERLDIPCPKTFNPKSLDELPALYSRLPWPSNPPSRRISSMQRVQRRGEPILRNNFGHSMRRRSARLDRKRSLSKRLFPVMGRSSILIAHSCATACPFQY